MPISDGYGTWNELGVVLPTHGSWVPFPVRTTELNATFRLTFLGDLVGANSFLWFRAEYAIANTPLVQQAIRVYPKAELQLIDYPMLPELRHRNITSRIISVQKRHRWQRRVGFTPDTNYFLKVEELW